MNTKTPPALVTPEMLIWARKRIGLTVEAVAARLQVKPEKISAWESDEDEHPTIHQAYKLAKIYHIPLSALYLKKPPRDFTLPLTDFRHNPRTAPEGIPPSYALRNEILTAEERRQTALELTSEDENTAFTPAATLTRNIPPERAGAIVREALGIPLNIPSPWGTPREAFRGWRAAIESTNTLVFLSSPHKSALSNEEAHGLVISAPYYPVIVVNIHDSPTRRLFTLVHEFTHLLLRQSGYCDAFAHTAGNADEVYCNAVASHALVPQHVLSAHPVFQQSNAQKQWSDETIEALAAAFTVSREVIVRRLLDLGLVTTTYYQQKREQYYKEWLQAREKRKGQRRHAPYETQIQNRFGKAYLQVAFIAYHENRITLTELASVLDTKVRHVVAMEKWLAYGT